MGEVWRARDSRLQREVAIKVLPSEMSSDAGRLKRFEKEARSASALNHPNIVTIYDIGSSDSISYIAMELVEGKTLRELLFSGPLPIKKVLAVGAQVAEGLARAHEAGIVHRDLKPENVMVTKDGRVKILDFGLAKLTHTGIDSAEGTNIPTETGTGAGVVMGTVGYMSPEQASGQPVDFRSDQFSFGSIAYELLTGKRAFQKKTAVDTMSAILNDEPEPIGAITPQSPTPLRWIVERCLAKEPRQRYSATDDLARDLATLRDHASEAVSAGALTAAAPRTKTALRLALAAIAIVAASVFAAKVLWRESPPSPLDFQRLTFRTGTVTHARFASDGQTVVYGARWGGEPGRVFTTRLGSPESSTLPLPDSTVLLAISSIGELAVRLRAPALSGSTPIGTLATMPLAGGAPREVAEDIRDVDWTPDGKSMVALRNGQLELPIGKVLYKANWLGSPRFSPKGDLIALAERREGRQSISVIDLTGKRTELEVVQGQNTKGLVWSPDGEEIWFAIGVYGRVDTIRAVTPRGRSRVVARLPGVNILQDSSRDGRVLVIMGTARNEALFLPAGETKEKDLSWFSGTDAADISADGMAVLLREAGEAGGPGGAAYLRRVDGSPAVKVTEGTAEALSPDAKWAACIRENPPRILLVPTGAGESRSLVNEGFEEYGQYPMRFFPDGRRLLFVGRERGHRERVYTQDVSGGKPRPLSTEGVTDSGPISPDGSLVIVQQPDGLWIYPVSGGERRPLPGVLKDEYVASWSEDGRAVYATVFGKLPFQIHRVEVATGRRELWKIIMPSDMTGVFSSDLLLLPNGAYVLNVKRYLSDLYLVEGLK
jgi:Tol biopolymer transport system component